MDNHSLMSKNKSLMSAMEFDTVSRMLLQSNNSALAVLAQRIPVYTVNSSFMREHFGKKEDDETNEARSFLTTILKYLKELAKFPDTTKDSIEQNLEKLKRQLLGHQPLWQNSKLLHILSEIRELIESYQHWLQTQGGPNPNLAGMAEKIARDIEKWLDDMPYPNTEYLGVYCPDWHNVNGHEKAIFICTQRIKETGKGWRHLLTKVTIHEFCHAYMDIEYGRRHHADPDNVTYWMEESMANVMTLQMIENFALKYPESLSLLEYARQFMLKQPAAYASAVKMFDNGICDYDLWAWNKDECRTSAAIKTWCSEMRYRGNSMDANTIRGLWDDVKKDIINRLSVDSQIKPHFTPASKKQCLKVTFPDGTVINNIRHIDTLKDFVIKVGPDKVADNPDIMQGFDYLVSKTKANTSGRIHKSFKDNAGNEYWINSDSSISLKLVHIQKIIDALCLTGVIVETIKKTIVEIKADEKGNPVMPKGGIPENAIVRIEDAVVNIPDEFFLGSNVSEVEIPRSVKRVGRKAFDTCRSLERITLDANPDLVWESCLACCENLKDIAFLAGVNIHEEAFPKMFSECSSLTDLSPLKDWDVSHVENMSRMFDSCELLTDLSPLKGWDVSGVKCMDSMFSGCKSLTNLSPLKDWDVSNVTDIYAMFRGCKLLTDITALKEWKISRIAYMGQLFKDCESLVDLSPLEDWNVSNVRSMEQMFWGCKSLTDISPLKDWNVSNVRVIGYMFEDCKNLKDLSPMDNWDLSNLEDFD